MKETIIFQLPQNLDIVDGSQKCNCMELWNENKQNPTINCARHGEVKPLSIKDEESEEEKRELLENAIDKMKENSASSKYKDSQVLSDFFDILSDYDLTGDQVMNLITIISTHRPFVRLKIIKISVALKKMC